MKKLYFLVFSLLLLTGYSAQSQCTFTSAFGSATIPASNSIVTISTCSFAGEYSTISGAVNGQTLNFTSSVATDFITIHSGTSNGPVVAFGTTPLNFANTFTGQLFAHWATNAACGTQSACRTTTVQCTSCSPPAPANDACANVIPIACGGSASGSTQFATLDGPATDCSGGSVAPDVWYSIVGTGGAITASLCGSAYDTQLDVYTGTCGSLVNIGGCNDDFCGLQSQMTWTSTLGTTYLIRVHGFSGATGAYTLNVTCCSTPTVNPVANQVLCNGVATAAVNFTGTPAGVVYNWTNNTPSIGLAASGTGNIASFNAVNAGTTPVIATITVTPTLAGCPSGLPQTFTITVNPTPTVNPVANQTVCNGSPTAQVAFTGPVAGTTYAWTNNTTSIGLGASGTGNIPSFTATNITTIPVMATITVTPFTTNASIPELFHYKFDGSGTSVPNLASAPPAGTATATIQGTQTQGGSGICNGTLIGSGAVSTTNFVNTNWATNLTGTSWTISFKTSNITPSTTLFYIFGDVGAAAFRCFTNGVAGANNWLLRGPVNDVLIPGGATVAPHTTTFVYDNVAGNIRGYLDGVLVATVTQTAPTINGAGPFKVGGYSANTGLPTGGLMDEFRIYNRALNATEVAALNSCAGGTVACTGSPTTFTYTVNPTPTAIVTPVSQTICSGFPITTIVPSGSAVSGTVYNWTRDNVATVTGIAASGAGNIAGTLTNTTTNPITVTFTIIPTANGCPGAAITATVLVNPTPVITFTPAAPVICNGQIQQITASVLPPTPQTFSQPATTIISAVGIANPYPSQINVAGLITTGVTVKSVKLGNFNHTFPDDVDVVLVSPTGQSVILMSDVGGSPDVVGLDYTLDDAAAISMADNALNPTGTYKPTNFGAGDNWPAPGPLTAPTSTTLSTFSGNPNGDWKLYVVDDAGGDQGFIGNWSITFGIPTLVVFSPITNLFTDPLATIPYTGTPINVVYARPTVTTLYTATTSVFGCIGTGTVNVTVNQLPTITVQPTPATQTVCPGNNVTYSVTATGTGLTYQWRQGATNLVNTVQISGATTNTLTIANVNASNSGSYTCVVSGTCPPPVTTIPVVLNVATAPIISAQPANVTVCVGQNASFTVATVGSVPPPTIYQWQVSANGLPAGPWVNLTTGGSYTATFTITGATTSQSGSLYRVLVTNICGQTTTSGNALLTVNALPTVTATALPARICISDTLVPLSGSPVGGSWSGIGVSGFNFVPSATAVGTYTLTYSFTNSLGCTNTATVTAKVEDCQERLRLLRDDALILYPNPNNGRFNIRINSTLYNYLGMKVYNVQGQLLNGVAVNDVLNSPVYSGLVYGRVIPIDLSKLPAGIYLVKFYYDDGVRTSEKTFKVVIGGH